MNNLKTHLVIASALITVASASTAHANWLDEVFTFREEQKPAVAPDRTIPTVEIISPYYNQEAASDWAHYYTRDDLKPVQTMYGSASMVMRPDGRLPQKPMEPKTVIGKPIDGSKQQIEARNHTNTIANERTGTMLGEPGALSDANNNGGGYGLQKETKIGEPVYSWRDKRKEPAINGIEPRPGDYDYKTAEARSNGYRVLAPEQAANGTEIMRTSDFNGGYGEKPDNYIVKRGDTLSEISEQDMIYGDWKKWPLIYDANRHQLNDPDLIYPKQNLGIPRNYNTEDENNARTRALQKTPPHTFYDGK